MSEESCNCIEGLLLSTSIMSDDLSIVRDDLISLTNLNHPIDGGLFASPFLAFLSDRSIYLYQYSSDLFTLYQTLTTPEASVSSLGFTSSNLFVLSLDGMLRCYHLSDYHLVFCHETPSNMLSMCIQLPYIFLGGNDYCIHCYIFDCTSVRHV